MSCRLRSNRLKSSKSPKPFLLTKAKKLASRIPKMATAERLILNNITGTTGLGKPLTGRTIHVLPSSGGYIIFSTAPTQPRTLLETIIDDLECLERRSDYVFKPSKRAVRAAKFYIFETYALMGAVFPRPSFVLDGEKGIIIKWVKNGLLCGSIAYPMKPMMIISTLKMPSMTRKTM